MAAEGLFRCPLEGCIAKLDMEIERRPYHRYCGCAVCKLRGCTKASQCNNAKISYPIRRSWHSTSMVMVASSPLSSSTSLMAVVKTKSIQHPEETVRLEV